MDQFNQQSFNKQTKDNNRDDCSNAAQSAISDQSTQNSLQSIPDQSNNHEINNNFITVEFNRPLTRDNTLSSQFNSKAWTVDEDLELQNLVQLYNKNWAEIARYFPSKTVKCIKKRWQQRKISSREHENWTLKEDLIIKRAYSELGGNWKLIAGRLSGRSIDSVKARYYSSIQRQSSQNNNDTHGSLFQVDPQLIQSDLTKDDEDLIYELLENSIQNDLATDLEGLNFENQNTNEQDAQESLRQLYKQMAALENYLNQTKDYLNELVNEGEDLLDS